MQKYLVTYMKDDGSPIKYKQTIDVPENENDVERFIVSQFAYFGKVTLKVERI